MTPEECKDPLRELAVEIAAALGTSWHVESAAEAQEAE